MVGQVVRHRLKNLTLITSLGEDNAHVELWWNSKSEDSIDVGADDLKMHECGEQLLEAFSCSLVQLGRLLLELLHQNVTMLLIIIVLLDIKVESTASKSVLAKNFDNVVNLRLVGYQAHDCVLFVFVVEVTQIKVRTRDKRTRESVCLTLFEGLCLLL